MHDARDETRPRARHVADLQADDLHDEERELIPSRPRLRSNVDRVEDSVASALLRRRANPFSILGASRRDQTGLANRGDSPTVVQ